MDRVKRMPGIENQQTSTDQRDADVRYVVELWRRRRGADFSTEATEWLSRHEYRVGLKMEN